MSALVVDASAVLAMLESEPEAPALQAAFVAASARWIAAVGALECGIVLTRRRGVVARAALDAFLARFAVGVVPFDDAQLRAAVEVYERFGRGRHPAALNLGDCCAYATARALRLPLLCKGGDFPRTDLDLVRW